MAPWPQSYDPLHSALNTAAVNRVKAAPATKVAYPAYGEELPPPRPAKASPVLVKYPGQK